MQPYDPEYKPATNAHADLRVQLIDLLSAEMEGELCYKDELCYEIAGILKKWVCCEIRAGAVVGSSRHGFGQAERGEFETVNQAWIRLLLIWPELSEDQRARLLAA